MLHKKVVFSGKKFVQFDDVILLDIFPKTWYTGISALLPPGAPDSGPAKDASEW